MDEKDLKRLSPRSGFEYLDILLTQKLRQSQQIFRQVIHQQALDAIAHTF
jgi:hypothetical protein